MNKKKVMVSIESMEDCNLHASFLKGWLSFGKTSGVEVVPFYAPRFVLPNLDVLYKEMIKTYQPDLIVHLKGEAVNPYTCAEVKKQGFNQVFVQIDDPFEFDKSISWSMHGVRTYTTDFRSVSFYTHRGVSALFCHFWFYDFGINNDKSSYQYDCTFVGTGYVSRVKFLQDYWVPGVPAIKCFGTLPFKNSAARVTHKEAWRVSAKTKVNLVFSDQPDGVMGTKNKMYEMMGQGAFCLVQQFPELDSIMPKAGKYDTFVSSKDLAEKINFYLQNDAIREQMALNASQHVRENYSAEKFAKTIYEDVISR